MDTSKKRRSRFEQFLSPLDQIAGTEFELETVAVDATDLDRPLTPPQRAAIFLMGRGASQQDAAWCLGVHPERLARWMSTPRFQRALHQERTDPTQLGKFTAM